MGAFMHGWWPVVILVVVLLLFGAPKLPGLAKSLGQSMRIFRGEVKQMKDENGKPTAAADAAPDAAPTSQASPTLLAETTTVEPGPPNSGAKPGS